MNSNEVHKHDVTVMSWSAVKFEGELLIMAPQMWIDTIIITKRADLFRYQGVMACKGMEQKFIFQGVRMLFFSTFSDLSGVWTLPLALHTYSHWVIECPFFTSIWLLIIGQGGRNENDAWYSMAQSEPKGTHWRRQRVSCAAVVVVFISVFFTFFEIGYFEWVCLWLWWNDSKWRLVTTIEWYYAFPL